MARYPVRRLRWEVGPLTDYAIELAGVTGRAPRVCFLPTACGDSSELIRTFYEAALLRGLAPSHLALFPCRTSPDITAHLLDQDVIWVWGGSVAGLLAMWRLHGVDEAMRQAWQAGVVLTGVSAGSICWHVGGTTDSFGPELRPVTDGLGLMPFSNGVHYDSEERAPAAVPVADRRRHAAGRLCHRGRHRRAVPRHRVRRGGDRA